MHRVRLRAHATAAAGVMVQPAQNHQHSTAGETTADVVNTLALPPRFAAALLYQTCNLVLD